MLVDLDRARDSIIGDHEMLDSTAVRCLLGKAATSQHTATGSVIALPASRQKLYPAFQFDSPHRKVRPMVAQINWILGAKADPWGVASWWLNPTAFADDPRSPAELAVAGGHEQYLLDMVDDLTQG